MRFKIKKVKLDSKTPEQDIEVLLPSGEKILLQYRTEGDFPSLDICFEKKRVVYNYNADLSDAPKVSGLKANVRLAEQLTIMLDPKSPDVR